MKKDELVNMGAFRVECGKDSFCLDIGMAGAGLVQIPYSGIPQLRATLDSVEQYLKRRTKRMMLLADVQVYRAQYPKHGRPAIAEALLHKHGGMKDIYMTVSALTEARERAIVALTKRIERLEKGIASQDD